MGFLDRFIPKPPARPVAVRSPRPPEEQPVAEPAAGTDAPVQMPALETTTPAPLPAPSGGYAPAIPLAPVAGGVLARLKDAREALALKDRAGAMAIYEEVLAVAGDRADVLVSISGELGANGFPREIIEFIAPRYDAQRHGPATGISLLQAYLAIRDPESAQHVLDLLFALNRPELEQRLLGFSNIIADMMLLGDEGLAAAPPPSGDTSAGGAPDNKQTRKIELASISKPIWFYGLENVGGLLPSKGDKLRRVAFGQLAVLGLEDLEGVVKRPEEELGRLSRGIPLWLAETLFFSANWTGITAVATQQREHYGLFTAEWAPENIRQLVETTGGGFDYMFTGALRQKNADYEMVLHLWEVKKFRVRKTFAVRWTPGTADRALAEFHTQWRTFMELKAYPADQGLAYAPAPNVRDYIEALGTSLTLFLVEKQILPAAQAVVPAELVARLGAGTAQSDFASLLALSVHARARRLALPGFASLPALAATSAVDQARQALSL
jgi:hypothetical protein